VSELFEGGLLRKYALKNALEHKGKASANSVIAKVIREYPELRDVIKDLMKTASVVVNEVNKLTEDQIMAELQESAPELLEKKVKEEKGLPELPNVKGKVVMRLAPNPNAPMHLGNTRMVILNDEYVKKYGGTLILKYDDTDPKNWKKRPTKLGYDSIQEDLNWLGVKVGNITYASKRIDRYYEVFEKLLSLGKAYICDCEWEKWKELKAKANRNE